MLTATKQRKCRARACALGFLVLLTCGRLSGQAPVEAQAPPVVVPVAVLPFQERGMGLQGLGRQTAELLTAALSMNEALYLVERGDLEKALGELELALSGAVNTEHAPRAGQLTGARLLVTGSIMEMGDALILVARVIGTETSRMTATRVRGSRDADIDELVDRLAAEIGRLIKDNTAALLPPPVRVEVLTTRLAELLGDRRRPSLSIRVAETHIGRPIIDPAVETELSSLADTLGFVVVGDAATAAKPEVVITGEGFSETALRKGNLVSVKARVEIKAVDRASGRLLAADRQTAISVDLAEHIAGKTALEEAARQIAVRLFPKITP